MAIIEELGLEVTVKVGGAAATEYEDPGPDVNDARTQMTQACHHYVESVDNAEFAIHVGLIPGRNTAQEWIARSRNHGLSFLVIDGGGVSSVTIHQHHISKLLRGIHDGKTKTLRKFRFAPVSIVDDANSERISIDTKVAQDLGLIRVCVRRAIIKEKPVRKARSRFGLEYDTDGLSLPEKALKGRVISHGTALSAPVRCVMKSALRLRYMGSEDSPLGIFHFKYRSKGQPIPVCGLPLGCALTNFRGAPARADHRTPKNAFRGLRCGKPST
ncbi:hypothetical protein F5883DRAFT_722602 [Diaporthe sp. PMI_573]|nr:hypothetical protein F5883DRAFT_722602 [Diaporthaceae sp. PMI_573]